MAHKSFDEKFETEGTCSLPPFCDSIFPQSSIDVQPTSTVNNVPPIPEFNTHTVSDKTILYKSFNDTFEAKGLHFVHLNIRSILYKIHELRVLLSENRISVIAITETWLNSSINDEEVYIDGYSILRRDRAGDHGGGVCLYIRSDIAFNVREDLTPDGIESLWIDILLPHTKPITLCVVYRPPRDNYFNEPIPDIS